MKINIIKELLNMWRSLLLMLSALIQTWIAKAYLFYLGFQDEIGELLEDISLLEVDLEDFAKERSQKLSQSHRRVRAITKEGQIIVKPQLPLDILGVYILQPGKSRG